MEAGVVSQQDKQSAVAFLEGDAAYRNVVKKGMRRVQCRKYFWSWLWLSDWQAVLR